MTETIASLVKELDSLLKERDQLMSEIERLKAQRLDNRKKLSESEVRDIRAAHRSGMSQRSLATAYDVNPTTINRIVRGIYHQ